MIRFSFHCINWNNFSIEWYDEIRKWISLFEILYCIRARDWQWSCDQVGYDPASAIIIVNISISIKKKTSIPILPPKPYNLAIIINSYNQSFWKRLRRMCFSGPPTPTASTWADCDSDESTNGMWSLSAWYLSFIVLEIKWLLFFMSTITWSS